MMKPSSVFKVHQKKQNQQKNRICIYKYVNETLLIKFKRDYSFIKY